MRTRSQDAADQTEKEYQMRYHFVATHDLQCVDLDALVAHHGGRNFISEAEVLSWFESLNADRPVLCDPDGSGDLRPECDGVYN